MFTSPKTFNRNRVSISVYGRYLFLLAAIIYSFSGATVYAQGSFSSGSTGADGAFAPTTSQTIQLPESGVFNFTTVTIPNGVTIKFTRNSKNTPVTILATGNVTINAGGTISVSGVSDPSGIGLIGGLGGPGGFDGGVAGFGTATTAAPGTSGDGPGGGGGGRVNPPSATGGAGGGGYAILGSDGAGNPSGRGGQSYGSSSLIPLIGGSGGGGGGSLVNQHGGAGGGGGGAILIASSGTIALLNISNNQAITADGGGGTNPSGSSSGGGGGGSGGAIRLIANKITGTANLFARGAGGGNSGAGPAGGKGSVGFIRVEAFDFNGFGPGGNTDPLVSISTPLPITVANGPQLKITSVAGVTISTSPKGSFQSPYDVVLPTTQTNPVAVELSATNIPTGTTVTVTIIPANGDRTTSTSSPLLGTIDSSTASASVTLPNGISVITATTTFLLSTATNTPMFINGEEVEKVEVAATYGGPSQVTYITKSGRRITQ